MTKIIAIFANAPYAMSGCYGSSSKYYREFVSNFEAGVIKFGSLHEDRNNYSKDLNNVFRDFKRAGLNYTQSKRKDK